MGLTTRSNGKAHNPGLAEAAARLRQARKVRQLAADRGRWDDCREVYRGLAGLAGVVEGTRGCRSLAYLLRVVAAAGMVGDLRSLRDLVECWVSGFGSAADGEGL